LLRRYLATADICIDPDPANPYNDRSTMIKMMEYMAAGKPIVAFDLLESRRSADTAAVYVPNNDELEFARQIAALIDDPPRREAMGREGHARIQRELGWPHQGQRLLEAYAALEPA
jgi:glycosyltransferase involved in cell wall biosynthesis